MVTVPPIVRHLILLLISGGLGWAATDLVPWLSGQTGYGVLLSMLITAALAYVTPLVQAYGAGKRSAPVTGEPLA